MTELNGLCFFQAKYVFTGEVLGQGSYGRVETCRSGSGAEFAAKIVEKNGFYSRQRVLKEIETFYLCSGHENIIQVGSKFYIWTPNCWHYNATILILTGNDDPEVFLSSRVWALGRGS